MRETIKHFGLIIAGVVFALAINAFGTARSPNQHHARWRKDAVISAASINTAKTFTLTEAEMGGFGMLGIFVEYTNSAGTAVVMTCTGSNDDGTTDFALQSCAVSAGTCTSTDATWSNAVSGDEDWMWKVDTQGALSVTCSFTATGGDGSDVATVDVVAWEF